MQINRGDIVFSSLGRPGVVLDRDNVTRKLTVENQGEKYQVARQYGFINGLSVQERERFYQIMDNIKSQEDPKLRVSAMASQIQELEQDPRNQSLVRYLKAEQAHIMFTKGIEPRVFNIDEVKATA